LAATAAGPRARQVAEAIAAAVPAAHLPGAHLESNGGGVRTTSPGIAGRLRGMQRQLPRGTSVALVAAGAAVLVVGSFMVRLPRHRSPSARATTATAKAATTAAPAPLAMNRADGAGADDCPAVAAALRA